MCQMYLASVSPECSRCGGGYCAGLGNYIPHEPWCRDDAEVAKRREQARKEREERSWID